MVYQGEKQGGALGKEDEVSSGTCHKSDGDRKPCSYIYAGMELHEERLTFSLTQGNTKLRPEWIVLIL